MLPKISFLARMSRDPEIKYGNSGTAFAKVGLVCSEKYGEKETTLFIDGTAFKKTAEMICNIPKGQRVYVTGKICTESWQDAQSGQNRSKIAMIIEGFEFVEPKQQGQPQNNGLQNQNQGFQQQNQGGGFQQQPQSNGFQENQHGSNIPF